MLFRSIVPVETGIIEISGYYFNGSFRIELWDDNMNKPFGIIQVYDSTSLKYNFLNNDQISTVTLQNGAVIRSDGSSASIKTPPNIEYTSDSLGIQMLQMVEEYDSSWEISGANGGIARLYASLYKTYNMRENSKVYNIKLQYFGENAEVLKSNLLNKDTLFEKDINDVDENTLYYIPSGHTINEDGIGLSVKQSVIKFGHR